MIAAMYFLVLLVTTLTFHLPPTAANATQPNVHHLYNETSDADAALVTIFTDIAENAPNFADATEETADGALAFPASSTASTDRHVQPSSQPIDFQPKGPQQAESYRTESPSATTSDHPGHRESESPPESDSWTSTGAFERVGSEIPLSHSVEIVVAEEFPKEAPANDTLLNETNSTGSRDSAIQKSTDAAGASGSDFESTTASEPTTPSPTENPLSKIHIVASWNKLKSRSFEFPSTDHKRKPVEGSTNGSTENVTSFEETVEHNAIFTTDFEDVTDRSQTIVVGHKCTRIFQESILWNVTDGGMLALKSCPTGYQGNMYRPCFSNGKWGNVDFSECRLERLGRMRHMIFHQVQKGMLGNMYVLADEFSKYLSSVDMKSPMDRLEAFEILNAFLKLDMNLRMDKSRDMKYTQALLRSANELIKKKTVLFSPGSQKNKLITEKAVEMIFDLTYFAEKALRGLLKTQKRQIVFKSSSNVVLYLYRGKLTKQYPLMNLTSEYEKEDEFSIYFNLEKTLQRSAYALIWVKGLQDLLSTETLTVNSDVAVATILSPLNSLSHLLHPPVFDIGLKMMKEVPIGYTLKCGQLWNMSHLWNTEDCSKASVKDDIVSCRCRHLGSISLLLEQLPRDTPSGPPLPVGKLIDAGCLTSLASTISTLIMNFILKIFVHKKENSLSIFILTNLLVCLSAIQITFMLGVNKTSRFEVCLSFAVLLHYLFLVSCFWVVSYSYYLLQRLRNVDYAGKIRDYCAFCWILPTLLLIVSFVGNPNGYETKQFCWLNVQRGILWSFVIPITGLILVNTIVMIMALKTFNEQMPVTHRNEIGKTSNSLRAGITLLPFFAINWFFGILAIEDSNSMGLQLIFFFTNSLQGILTFVFFCMMDSNFQMMLRLKFREAKKPKVSSMRLKKSGSFPILERPLITLTDDKRHDCTPLLANRSSYHDAPEDPCCSNIRI